MPSHAWRYDERMQFLPASCIGVGFAKNGPAHYKVNELKSLAQWTVRRWRATQLR